MKERNAKLNLFLCSSSSAVSFRRIGLLHLVSSVTFREEKNYDDRIKKKIKQINFLSPVRRLLQFFHYIFLIDCGYLFTLLWGERHKEECSVSRQRTQHNYPASARAGSSRSGVGPTMHYAITSMTLEDYQVLLTVPIKRKKFCSLLTSVGQREKFWVPSKGKEPLLILFLSFISRSW